MSGILMEKYKNAVLYLCDGLGGTVRGKIKLLKLLYYVDFDRYEYNESCMTVTGDEYEAKERGPVPKNHKKVLEVLEQEGSLKKTFLDGSEDVKVYEVLSKPDMEVFDEEDKFILSRVVSVYGKLSEEQLIALTHSEAPFVATDQDDYIVYNLSFYRGTKFDDDAVAA